MLSEFGPVEIQASVCFSAQTGKHLLVLSLTAFDPDRTRNLSPGRYNVLRVW